MTDSYNAAERQHVKLAEKRAKLESQQRAEVVTRIMSNSAGRGWMLSLLEGCHIFATSFTGEAISSAFAEGERNIGLRLLSDIMSACPEQYMQMMVERNARDSTDTARRTGLNRDTDRSEPEAGRYDEYDVGADED